jgi:hypothetical protein
MYALAEISTKTEIIAQRSVSVLPNISSQSDNVQTKQIIRVYTDGTRVTEVTDDSRDQDSVSPTRTVQISGTNLYAMIALVFLQVVLVTMVYGPIAAFLVELFPTRIRYTSMSLPYHIGNGVFGGLTPLIATYLAGQTSDPLAGLWYPISVAALCFAIGMIYLPNRVKEPHD